MHVFVSHWGKKKKKKKQGAKREGVASRIGRWDIKCLHLISVTGHLFVGRSMSSSKGLKNNDWRSFEQMTLREVPSEDLNPIWHRSFYNNTLSRSAAFNISFLWWPNNLDPDQRLCINAHRTQTCRRKWLTPPRRKEIRRGSATTYQRQFIKSPRQLQHHHGDRQGNNMHDRMMFGKHTQVYVYDIL